MVMGFTRISHQGGEMIAQEFGCTEDFAKEWNNSVYSRLNKILCESKIKRGLVHLVRNVG